MEEDARLSLTEVHQLTNDLAASGLIWQPPVDVTRAQADEIRARWAAARAVAYARVLIDSWR